MSFALFQRKLRQFSTSLAGKKDLEGATVVKHESADAFLLNCAAWLSKDESLNHGLLSLAHALQSNRHIHQPPFIFCHIEDRNNVLGCAIYAEPDGLVLSEMDSATSAALFPSMFDKINLPSRIFGPVEPAIRLAEPIVHLLATHFTYLSLDNRKQLSSLLRRTKVLSQ